MIQRARINFNLAELSDADGDLDNAVIYYKIAFDSLVAGGIDLSMKKWLELVSLYARVYMLDFGRDSKF